MRLDAHKGDTGFKVWHATQCKEVPRVVWVDDDLLQWCQYIYPAVVINDYILRTTHDAKRIDIFMEQKLVVIDMLDTVSDAEIAEALELIGGGE